MTEKLPPHLLRLFVPRPALKHETPLDRDLRRRRGPTIDGIGSYFNLLGNDDPDYKPQETPEQARLRRRAEKLANNEKKIKAQAEHWDPHKDAKASGDPYKTLFIGRLSYEATEEDIRRAFDRYGKIVNVALVREQDTQKSRGYAFIEFEDERDMKDAYKEGDGMKLLDRRVVVDVERGRTVKDWRPKRLGGGLGQTRVGGPDENQRYSGRDPAIGGGYQPPEESSRHSTRSYSGRGYEGRSSGSGYGSRSGGHSSGRDYRDRGNPHDRHYRGRSRSPRREYRDREYDRGGRDHRDRGGRDHRDRNGHRY